MQTLTLIGHVAIDRVITIQGEKLQLGGPPTYFSLVSELLGYKPKVITKVGEDFPEEYILQLSENGVDVRDFISVDSKTTRFILDYRRSERRLSVDSICEDIQVLSDFHDEDAVILAPIIGEISSDIKERLDDSVNALDPQGFLRKVHDNGVLTLRNWFNRELVQKIHVLKSSETELGFLTSRDLKNGLNYLKNAGVEVPIATSGKKGAYILSDNGLFNIPAYNQTKFKDGTGAGDCFLSGFFSTYVKGENPLWCGAVGSATASAVVETNGPRVNIDSKELLSRAEAIYQEVRRLD